MAQHSAEWLRGAVIHGLAMAWSVYSVYLIYDLYTQKPLPPSKEKDCLWLEIDPTIPLVRGKLYVVRGKLPEGKLWADVVSVEVWACKVDDQWEKNK